MLFFSDFQLLFQLLGFLLGYDTPCFELFVVFFLNVIINVTALFGLVLESCSQSFHDHYQIEVQQIVEFFQISESTPDISRAHNSISIQIVYLESKHAFFSLRTLYESIYTFDKLAVGHICLEFKRIENYFCVALVIPSLQKLFNLSFRDRNLLHFELGLCVMTDHCRVDFL